MIPVNPNISCVSSIYLSLCCRDNLDPCSHLSLYSPTCLAQIRAHTTRLVVPVANLGMLSLQGLTERTFQVPAILVGVLISLCLMRWNSRRLRVKKLGNKAPAAVYWAPLGNNITCAACFRAESLTLSAGLDLFATAISRIFSHDFFAWTRQILDVPGRTVSLNLLGVKVLMTDDPENTKAVLSTKVNARASSLNMS